MGNKALGTQARAINVASGLFCGTLAIMARKLPPNERVKPKPDGKKARAAAVSARHKKHDLTDEQIVECRRAFEAGEKTCRSLADEHGVRYMRMYKILNYETRAFGL